MELVGLIKFSLVTGRPVTSIARVIFSKIFSNREHHIIKSLIVFFLNSLKWRAQILPYGTDKDFIPDSAGHIIVLLIWSPKLSGQA